MRKSILLFGIFLIFLCLFFFIGCERDVTISFESNGGTSISPQKIKYGGKVNEPEIPIKNGFEFEGWFLGQEKWNFVGFSVSDDITLRARWSCINYSITYDLQGGYGFGNPESYTIQDEIQLVAPQKTGYSFIGWTSENIDTPTKEVVLQCGTWGNKHFIANWSAETYTINYDLNGFDGNHNNVTTYQYDSPLITLNPPQERRYYEFLGWYDEFHNQIYSIGNGCENRNLMLKAEWKYIFNISENSLISISDYGRTLYNEIIVPDGITTIGERCFSSYTNLKKIILPDSLVSIENYAFADCNNLQDIEVSPNLETIGENAFYACKSLNSMIIPPAVSVIMPYTFAYCENLKNVTLSSNLSSIGEYAFNNCKSLESITIPDSVTTIEKHSFSFCYKLNNVVLSKNLTSIGWYAFFQTGSLKTITIPKNVSRISEGAFYRSGLVCVIFDNTTGWYCQQYTDSSKTWLVTTDTSQNATNLSLKYSYFTWIRSTLYDPLF